MDKAAATEASRVYVYFHCFSVDSGQLWYRLKFDDEEEDKETNIIKLNRVATLPRFGIGGIYGNWTVVGNDIYYAGGYQDDFIVPRILKHTIDDESDLEEWKFEGSEPPLARWKPFVTDDVANNKLYVVGGYNVSVFDKPEDTPCGLVYDLVTKTWTCLQDVHLIDVGSYNIAYQASVVLKDDDDEAAGPMEIAFYDIGCGAMQFLNVAEEGGKLFDSAVHREFNLRPPCACPPPTGLSDADFNSISIVPGCVPAVVIDRTFYWFNFDMCLYGYDSKAKTWIKSQCLQEYFPKPYYQTYDYQMPLLLGLTKSKMLVILPTSDEEFTITSLHVVVDETVTKLHVSVEKTRAYHFDDPYAVFLGGKAMLRCHCELNALNLTA